jgi:ABC-2 type transport system permease protein
LSRRIEEVLMTSTSLLALPAPVGATASAPSAARIYALETWYELLKMLRQPSYSVPTIGFPVMFYLLFGVLLGGRGVKGIDLAEYLIASYGAFGVVGAAMFGFGVGIAAERAQGWLLLKRVSPMPPAALVLAKVAMSAVFGLIIIALMGLCGGLLGGVRLSAGEWAELAAVLVFGAVPFCLIGLAIGLAVSPAAAPGIVNLIHLPLAFVSGLALPVEAMPAAIRTLAQALPQYHLGQLALGAIGYARQPEPLTHVLVLAATTLVAGVMAARAYRRHS